MKNGKFLLHSHAIVCTILIFLSLRFRGRLNTMIVFLFRPSPQVPEPSATSAEKCYVASIFNVAMQREQIATGSVDLTWIFTQSLFMALNTILWSLSYPEIRKEHPIDEVQGHLSVALEAIMLAAKRWPGVESALLLYRNLVAACLKAYNTEESFVVHSPSNSSNHATPGSSQDVTSPPPMSSPSSTATSHNPRFGTSSITDASPSGTTSRAHSADVTLPYSQGPASTTPSVNSIKATHYQTWNPPMPSQQTPIPNQHPSSTFISAPYVAPPVTYADLTIDRNTPFNTFPTVVPGIQGWDPNVSVASTTASHLAYVDAAVNPMNWAGSIGNQYSQYFNEAYPTPSWHERTLSHQEQVELMASLGDNIPDVSAQLVRESATFYQS